MMVQKNNSDFMDKNRPIYSILIVDDDPLDIEMLSQYLEDAGLKALTAKDGSEGLIKAREIQPDLILLDIMMPGMDSFEVCRAIKADESITNIPVIILTAMNNTEDKIKGFDAGAIDFIIKPFPAKEILSRINTHISLNAMRQQAAIQNAALKQEIAEWKETEKKLLKAKARLELRVENGTAKLAKVNRMLTVIDECNQAIIRAGEEMPLLNSICDIIAHHDDYPFIWIGFNDPEYYSSIRPVVVGGSESDYMDAGQNDTKGRSFGRDITSIAIRDNMTVYIEDFEKGSSGNRRDRIPLKQDYLSGISIPLRDEYGNSFGALTLYSREKNIFTKEECRLLEKLIENLSVGIISLRSRAERKLLEMQRLANLQFLENLDLIDTALQKSSSINQMMKDVLDAVLSIFDCDRAFLLYPCDPEAEYWAVPMESCKSEYPGAGEKKLNIPMTEDFALTMRILLQSEGPVSFGSGSDNPLPAGIIENHQVQSFIGMAIYPKLGDPWQFGLHQCSHPREWKPQESRLFSEIGHRISDGLTSLLMYQDLLKSEIKYRRIIETASEGIVVLDADERISFINSRMLQMLGYVDGEAPGKYLTDFVSEEDHQDFIYRMNYPNKNQPGYNEFRFNKSNGETLWTMLSSAPIYDVENVYNGTFLMFTDITENRGYQERLRLLGFAIDKMHESAFLINKEGRFIFVNEEACRSLGYTQDELLKMPYCDIDSDFSSDCLEGLLEKLENTKSITRSSRHRAKNGRIFPVEISYTLIDYSGQKYILSLARDTTDRKRTAEIRRLVEMTAGISQELASLVTNYESQNEATTLSDLDFTPREIEISRLVMKGLPTKSIAADLRLAIPTIKSHLSRIYRKINVSGRMEFGKRIAEEEILLE